jgi:RimJ/RimL family protein N-acetyltransferase
MEEFRPVGVVVPEKAVQWPQRIAHHGHRVDLEPLQAEKHADALYEVIGQQEQFSLWDYFADGPFADKASFVKKMTTNEKSEDPLFYAIIDKSTTKPLGYVALMRIDITNRVVEVGNVLFSKQLQRTVAATECLYLLATYAIDTLGFRRYEWKCNSLNAPSMRAAKRLGFQYEGMFRQHRVVKGRNRDTCWFSIIDEEWMIIRKAMENWLDSSNFDEEGKQRASLEAIRLSLAENA